MGKGQGKKNRHGHSSNPQSGSSHGIGKRFRKESTQQASRIYPDLRSGPTVAPNYAFVPPAYPNVPSFPSQLVPVASYSWDAVHGEEMVSMDELPGYIFMCNGKTKADCYKYRVFGLPSARMDVLEKIKPRMKLFLYDFDLKLLHGIYIAASNGKLAIEPTAFGGKFSAQVRFDIFKDCLPLPENVFKHIIRENYQGSHKFKQELSGKQVTNLISLFRPIAMPLPAERPGFEVPHALATRVRSMHLPPPPPGHFYPAEAHQSYHPEYPALPPQDPYSRYVALPRDIEALSSSNVPVQPDVTGPSQFSAPLQGHAPLPPSTRTAAYWAAVASEGLKQVYPSTYHGIPSVSTGPGLPVTYVGATSTRPPVPKNIDAELLQQLGGTANDNHHNPAVASAKPFIQEPSANPNVRESSAYWAAVASEGVKQAYPSTYQGIPSVSTGPGLPVTSAGAASTPPPVPENIDAELLQQLGSTANDNHHNPAVASAKPFVQEPSAYWAAVASEGVKQAYPSTYQGIPSVSTGPGLPVTSTGAASSPPPVPKNIDVELLQQLGSTANDNHHNPAVASAKPFVQEPSAYWAVVASEGVKQAYPSTYQGIPSVSTGPGLPVTSTGAASTPPPVPKNIDVELLQQLGSTANDNHLNPAANPIIREPSANPIVREPSANPIVREPSVNPIAQEPALVSSQFQAPMYGTNAHLQPSSSSTSGYWTTTASEDPNLAYSVPYQGQWQPSTNIGVGAENVSAGSVPPYSTVQGSTREFVPQGGTSNNYYAHNVHLATTNGPLQAHDQVTYYPSAPAYWTSVPSQDLNQLYSSYHQVLPPGSSVITGDPNQLSSRVYQVLPPGSSGHGGLT